VLKIFKDIYINFILKVAGVFTLLFIIVALCLYVDLEGFLLWTVVTVAFVLSFVAVVLMINILHRKLNEDIDTLTNYLQKIDAKEYDAEIKIKNYLEFLQLSLLLKNLIKRLVQKDKKLSKK